MGLLDLFFGKLSYSKRTVSYNGNRFNVEVADSFRKLMVGLMDHAPIPRNGGMLFVFSSPGAYGFWMMHMKFSIDIIWLNERGKVVFMAERAEPCRSMLSCKTIKPNRKAKYVLELYAGTASRLGVKVGSVFSLQQQDEAGGRG